MESPKINVLGIAPYEAMKNVMEKLARKRPQIEMDVYVGDLKKGVDIAQKNIHGNYDVIISRGGTAEMIGKVTPIPVIEISLSVYDILRAMKLAENYSDKYAIVGFPSITGSAHLLCDLLQYKIDIVTIHSENEVEATLRDLKKNGCRMIVCDMIANTTAKKLGLNSILITSGNESIENAFDQAYKLCISYANIKEENSLLSEIIQGENSYTFVFDEKQNLHFSTWDNTDSEITDILRREIPETLNGDNYKAFRNIDGNLFSINSRVIEKPLHRYAVFYVSSTKVPMATSKYGILFSNKREAEQHFYNSFYSITGSMQGLRNTVEQISQSSFPVMISGEEGTGKEQIARAVYAQSSLQHNPLIAINCSLVNDKSWGFLTNHYNSPLNDNNNTIYFRNIEELPSERRKQLLSIILDMNLDKRNRLIFSCISASQTALPPAAREFVNLLSCMTIHLPPLRERINELPTISSLYLGNLNVELARQIIGFEPEAMALLEAYDWPYNYTQFKRVINELAVITSTPYISVQNVSALLEKERASSSAENGQVNETRRHAELDVNRTLDEITCDIISQVLSQNRGNQSAAAKQLGISRTTLWRYMNRK